MDNEKIGKFIKQLRQEKEITQKELGEKLNITDKAISKWERGLSLPDITILKELSDFFEIDVSELLNGEKGIKEKINIEEVEQKYKNIEAEKNKQTKKKIGIFSLIILLIATLVQTGYVVILKKHDYEYISDSIFYIINEIIVISIIISIKTLIKDIKGKKLITNVIFVVITIINVAFMINNGINNKCIISFSNNFSNELILKINKDSGAVKLYRDAKFVLFAKEKEQLPYEVDGKIKKQWVTNDICGITYTDTKGKIREYVATYGDRGNGISYNYVSTSILGNWQASTQYGSTTQLLADSKGITITRNGEKELFEYSDCKQFGTIALVLYKNEIPKYLVALDENCELDEKTNIIKKGGTITLTEISMNKTLKENLYCVTYKKEDDMSNYNVVNVGKNEYKIQNGIMYISFDGVKTIEVPGDFSQMNGIYTDENYQISKEKVIFYYLKNNKKYLVFSDDMGENWNTVEIENESSIKNIHFINSKVGFILKFYDVVVGNAVGAISKTTDGGENWNDIYFGIGEEKIFKSASQIKFINENVGFLTMPDITGESAELYITKDGGNNFTKLEILNDNIYDYYNLPTFENGKLYLKITQGTDGDYNGDDYKEYCSEDEGKNWAEINI